MYTQDYDEKYPLAQIATTQLSPDGKTTPWSSTIWAWQQIIYPYTKNSQIYRCPSSPYTGAALYVGNYGANWLMLTSVTGVSMAEVSSAASTYMIFDSGYYSLRPDVTWGSALYAQGQYYIPGTGSFSTPAAPISAGFTDDYTSGRHFLGVNMGFADGHVKWLKSSVVLKEANNYHSSTSNAWDPKNPN